jgi:hypothetical protein
LLAVLVFLVAACGSPPAAAVDDGGDEPALVELVAGQEDLHRITLTPEAVARLGVETAEVAGAVGGGGQSRVPYSAVIYDAAGAAWVYVVDGSPNSFVRHAVTIDEIVADPAGDYAALTSGPAGGTSVVSVGVAELFGTEFEVGH